MSRAEGKVQAWMSSYPPKVGQDLLKHWRIGVHTGKTALYRKSSYPDPKKGKPLRKVMGKFVFLQ